MLYILQNWYFSFILAVIVSSFTIIPVIFLMNGGSYSYKNELAKKAKSYKSQKVKEYNSYKREIDRESDDFIAESRENLLLEILDYPVDKEVNIIPHKTRNSNLMLKSNTISHKKRKSGLMSKET